MMLALGLMLTLPLSFGPVTIGPVTLSLDSMFLGTALSVMGLQSIYFACLAHVFLRRALVSGDICGDASVNLRRVLRHHGLGGDDGLC